MGTSRARLSWFVTLMIISATTCAWAQFDGITESPDGEEAVQVYFTQKQALAKVFVDADSTTTDFWELSDDEIADLESALGWRLEEWSFDIRRAWHKGKDLGYAVITNEQGRFKPITFMVHINSDFRVEMVLVMVYRESHGNRVRHNRFLKQFREKDTTDYLRLNRDIIAVSGATMSSRGITAGVKKVLNLVEMRYGESGKK